MKACYVSKGFKVAFCERFHIRQIIIIIPCFLFIHERNNNMCLSYLRICFLCTRCAIVFVTIIFRPYNRRCRFIVRTHINHAIWGGIRVCFLAFYRWCCGVTEETCVEMPELSKLKSNLIFIALYRKWFTVKRWCTQNRKQRNCASLARQQDESFCVYG